MVKKIKGVSSLKPWAMDDSPENLEAANHNYKQLRDGWCKCADQDNVVYYRSAWTGSHGWMCADCYGIVQTG